jgi:hypothetical protein
MRPGSDESTPLPAEEAAGENPPNGAMVDYYLNAAATGPVTLEIFNGAGKLVRRYSSAEKVPPINEKTLDIPIAWIHPPEPPSADPGMHRFVWDLHYLGAGGGRRGGMAALMAMFGFGGGPWAMPGDYTVKLTVNGQSYEQPLMVKMDPRVKTSQEDLQKQFDMAQQVLVLTGEVNGASRQAAELLDKLKALEPKVASRKNKALAEQVEKISKNTTAILGQQARGELAAGAPEPTDRTTLRYVAGALGEVERAIESADVAPTTDAASAFEQDGQIVQAALQKWDVILGTDLPALNKELQKAHLNLDVIELGPAQPGGGE